MFDPFASLTDEQTQETSIPGFNPFSAPTNDNSAKDINNQPVTSANPFGSSPFGSDPFGVSTNAPEQTVDNSNDPFGDLQFPPIGETQGNLSGEQTKAKPKSSKNVPSFNFDELLGGNSDNISNNGNPTEDGSGMAVFDLDGGGGDDDTPLPPMKSQNPPQQPKPKTGGGNKKSNDDMFASLFGNSGSKNGSGSKKENNPFGNIDFDLDVEVVSTGDDNSSLSGGNTTAPVNDSFDMNLFDLDAPVAGGNSSNAKKAGNKKGGSEFNLDEFDLSKFNI